MMWIIVHMEVRRRFYDALLEDHFAANRQMAFISGPRQVGKTTTCRNHSDEYIDWDNIDDREQILSGPARLAGRIGLDRLSVSQPTALFDELHKYPQWKQFLKGFYDTYADRLKILVTGSSRMNIYRKAGDSLMGRYFHYRMHPFSIAETDRTELPESGRITRIPMKIEENDFEALWEHGGYPEPFLKRDKRFTSRWQSLRLKQLAGEEIRDLTRIQHFDQMELLIRLLAERSSSQLIYSNLARDVRVTIDTARRWVDMLCGLHYGFLVRPWHRSVSRSLKKEPKWFLRDWASIGDPGRKTETFVACHLLKAVEGWTDLGYGDFGLYYIRDRNKREVDFIVVRDGNPWFLVEVKYRDDSIGRSIRHFQEVLKVPFAFQVVLDAEYVDADCFKRADGPVVVPARTFLSQLL
jgi:predicted AAA+ superfamily ATPase